MNGAGHGIAIYPVSRNTTRQDIGKYLCQAGTPSCNADTQTARSQHWVFDREIRLQDVGIDSRREPGISGNQIGALPRSDQS